MTCDFTPFSPLFQSNQDDVCNGTPYTVGKISHRAALEPGTQNLVHLSLFTFLQIQILYGPIITQRTKKQATNSELQTLKQ